ncbi:MAG TPA: trypsin-like peptidase domain-containing protein [Thermomicrobiales bacterium]|nr:trypsin-like peptidase domain-containing protein [Thermomicrobiales bacterium]
MKKPRVVRQISFVLMAFLLALGIIAGPGLLSSVTAQESPATPAAATPSSESSDTSSEELTRIDLVKKVTPAVVSVINMTTAPTNPLGQQSQSSPTSSSDLVPQGEGTGFIIDTDGHVVTNWHVVTGGEAFQVVLSDGTTVDATLVGSDPRDDLAVVKIDPSNVSTTVSFGDSSQLQVGQDVVAMGSPLGEFTNSVTAGIVSGLGRNEFASNSPLCQDYSDLIQHDAAINPGNSGGPLFNMNGEVIGVNTLGISEISGQPVQGLFFAIPSNTVQEMVKQLIETGTVKQAYLGITYVALDPSISAQYQLPVDHGMAITNVQASSPASDAGLQPGDIITAIDGKDITPDNPISNFNLEPDQKVKLSVTNADSGAQRDVDLTVGQAPFSDDQCSLQSQP